MSVALITTTINVPRVLSLLATTLPPLNIFVALERDTKSEVIDYLNVLKIRLSHKNIQLHYTTGEQYACSALIGWNSIQRRNIALLDALKMRPRTIISVDDDNIPLQPGTYTTEFVTTIGVPFSGIAVSERGEWFDPGQLLVPQARHRGFPIDQPATFLFEPEHAKKIGVAAGMCLGDPDVSAVDRISQQPTVLQASELARAGVAVSSNLWTVFNSQNTAIDAALAPAWFMIPGVGRYDDIYASLIVQRIMRERKWFTHFGPPFCWQERNQHNLIRDLRAEIDGMDRIVEFARFLDETPLPAGDALVQVRHIWSQFSTDSGATTAFFSRQTIETAHAFLDDCEGVMR